MMQESGMPGHSSDPPVTIGVGSTVRCCDGDGEYTYTMVVPSEADVVAGRISVGSPVGRALLGRWSGEEVVVRTPSGLRMLTVLSVAEDDQPLGRASEQARGATVSGSRHDWAG
jgi:transcription elongation GreA/GreB family factor